eukprot:gene11763-12835_t
MITYPSTYREPSSCTTSIPNSKPTALPTVLQTPSQQPTSYSTTTHYPTRSNETFRPSTRRPTGLNPTRSPTTQKPSNISPTEQPSKIPTKSPQTPLPSLKPTVAPINTLNPTKQPTRRPTHLPTIRLSLPTSSPSHAPTLSTSNNLPIIIDTGGGYDGSWNHRLIIVNSTDSVLIKGKGSYNVYRISPRPSMTITIIHFKTSDKLDFSEFTSFHSLSELSYSTIPLVIELPNNQRVVLSSMTNMQLLSASNFIFSEKEDATTSSSIRSGLSSITSVLSDWSTTTVALTVIFVVLLIVSMVSFRYSSIDAIKKKREKRRILNIDESLSSPNISNEEEGESNVVIDSEQASSNLRINRPNRVAFFKPSSLHSGGLETIPQYSNQSSALDASSVSSSSVTSDVTSHSLSLQLISERRIPFSYYDQQQVKNHAISSYVNRSLYFHQVTENENDVRSRWTSVSFSVNGEEEDDANNKNSEDEDDDKSRSDGDPSESKANSSNDESNDSKLN